MVSKLAFLFAISVYSALTFAGGILLWQRPDERTLWLILVGGTASIVMLGFFVFVYKLWSTINDGYVRISPLVAALGMLIPLVNVLWLFIAVGLYARNCNAYITRHDVPTKRLPTWLFLVFCVFAVASFIPGAALGTVPIAIGLSVAIIWTSVEATNAIIHHQQAEAAVQQPTL